MKSVIYKIFIFSLLILSVSCKFDGDDDIVSDTKDGVYLYFNDIKLTPNRQDVIYGTKGGTATIKIGKGIRNWSIEYGTEFENPSWITFSQLEGDREATVTLTISPLPENVNKREAYINIDFTNSLRWGSINCVKIIQSSINGKDCVDLGLPSGRVWATKNIGAETESDYGDYIAWGEIYPKSEYTEGNSVIINPDNSRGDLLYSEYDAANQRWDYPWRMPKKEDFEELINKCIITRAYSADGRVEGLTFTGPNGASIFLPLSGYALDNTFVSQGEAGYYWSSESPDDYYDESNDIFAYILNFTQEGSPAIETLRPFLGCTIRPVADYIPN